MIISLFTTIREQKKHFLLFDNKIFIYIGKTAQRSRRFLAASKPTGSDGRSAQAGYDSRKRGAIVNSEFANGCFPHQSAIMLNMLKINELNSC